MTGRLALTPEGRVERSLDWARIKDGAPELSRLPPLAHRPGAAENRPPPTTWPRATTASCCATTVCIWAGSPTWWRCRPTTRWSWPRCGFAAGRTTAVARPVSITKQQRLLRASLHRGAPTRVVGLSRALRRARPQARRNGLRYPLESTRVHGVSRRGAARVSASRRRSRCTGPAPNPSRVARPAARDRRRRPWASRPAPVLTPAPSAPVSRPRRSWPAGCRGCSLARAVRDRTMAGTTRASVRHGHAQRVDDAAEPPPSSRSATG